MDFLHWSGTQPNAYTKTFLSYPPREMATSKKRSHVHTANSMMRASGQPADAWAFWFWGSGQVALESAEIMFSHKNVKGYGELSWQYHNNTVFYEFQGVMNNLTIHAALQSTSLTDLSISVSYKSLKLLVLLKPLELNDKEPETAICIYARGTRNC